MNGEQQEYNKFPEAPPEEPKAKIVISFSPLELWLLILMILASFSLGANIQKNMIRNPSHLWLREVKHLDKQIIDRISDDDIIHHGDSIEILGDDFRFGEYSNTNSMLPLVDIGSTGIYLKTNESTKLYLGDVISFKTGNKSITHRIVRIKQDGLGFIYVTRGDNNMDDDSYIVRKSNITGVMVGVIW